MNLLVIMDCVFPEGGTVMFVMASMTVEMRLMKSTVVRNLGGGRETNY